MTLDANIIIGYLDGDKEIIVALRRWQGMSYTFLFTRSPLVTRDVKDFKKVSGLEIIII